MPGGKFALLLLRLGNAITREFETNLENSQLFVDMVFALLKLSFSM